MSRCASRNDTAHHRNLHDGRHPLARGARLARHLVFASQRPIRSLGEVLGEIDRLGIPIDKFIKLKARTAYDGGLPYLHDETGEVWR